jgi:cbb3-type cytochrome oxidase subunit 1
MKPYWFLIMLIIGWVLYLSSMTILYQQKNAERSIDLLLEGELDPYNRFWIEISWVAYGILFFGLILARGAALDKLENYENVGLNPGQKWLWNVDCEDDFI